MQPLARDGLTAQQVTALLLAYPLEVSSGLELLRPDLSLASDVSDDLAGGTVERNLYADIHGTCRLTVSRAFVWGVDLVRPYMRLTGAGVSARFNLGVYALETPRLDAGATPVQYAVTGYDRVYLLARQVGDSYTVAAGTEVLAAVRSAIAAAGLSGVLLDGSAAGVTVPTARVWPLLGESGTPTTWLRIVNDLLSSINYRGIFADENGLYRSEPYVEPAARAPEFTFDADVPLPIVGESRSLTEDRYKRPNRWVFVNKTLPGTPPSAPTEGAGIYTVNDTADQAARGLVWASVVEYEAATQDALVGLGNRRVASDKRVTATVEVEVGPFPAVGHADVYLYRDVALGSERKVQGHTSSIDLTGGATKLRLEAVVA